MSKRTSLFTLTGGESGLIKVKFNDETTLLVTPGALKDMAEFVSRHYDGRPAVGPDGLLHLMREHVALNPRDRGLDEGIAALSGSST